MFFVQRRKRAQVSQLRLGFRSHVAFIASVSVNMKEKVRDVLEMGFSNSVHQQHIAGIYSSRTNVKSFLSRQWLAKNNKIFSIVELHHHLSSNAESV